MSSRHTRAVILTAKARPRLRLAAAWAVYAAAGGGAP
jgi:hypothetical protein